MDTEDRIAPTKRTAIAVFMTVSMSIGSLSFFSFANNLQIGVSYLFQSVGVYIGEQPIFYVNV